VLRWICWGSRTGVSLGLVIRLNTFVFLLLSTWVVYRISASITLALIFQASFTVNSAGLLGYNDMIPCFFLLQGIYALKKEKPWLFTLYYTVSCTMKWQPLIFGPFFLLYFFERRVTSFNDLRELPYKKMFTNGFLPSVCILLPLGIVYWEKIWIAVDFNFGSRIMSGNAFNLPWMVGWLEDCSRNFAVCLSGSIPMRVTEGKASFIWAWTAGFGIVYGVILLSFLRQQKSLEKVLEYSILGFFCYTTISKGVHENHIGYVSMLAFALAGLNRNYLKNCILFAVLVNLNLVYFYGITGKNQVTLISHLPSIALTVLFIACFCQLFWVTICKKLSLNSVWSLFRNLSHSTYYAKGK